MEFVELVTQGGIVHLNAARIVALTDNRQGGTDIVIEWPHADSDGRQRQRFSASLGQIQPYYVMEAIRKNKSVSMAGRLP